MNKYIYIILILLLYSCNISNIVEKQAYTRDTELPFTHIVIDNDSISIFAEKYVDNIHRYSFYHNFDTVVKSNKFLITKHITDSLNFNDYTEIDTFITAISNSDTLVYANAYSGILLWKMRLHSKEIKADTNLYVSCSLETINELFNIEIRSTISNFIVSSPGEIYNYTIKDGVVTNITFDMEFL